MLGLSARFELPIAIVSAADTRLEPPPRKLLHHTCEKTNLPACINRHASQIRQYRPMQLQIDAGHGFS
jgi:hypothetical protein